MNADIYAAFSIHRIVISGGGYFQMAIGVLLISAVVVMSAGVARLQ